MTAQAIYRRWRPQDFDDVIGQAHITQTLRNAVDTDRLAHAYLFTGPRGTGKTSVARILAKAVNCVGPEDVAKPCNACDICRSMTEGRSLDLIEIDAASNTGVDDVRDLREKIGFAPNETRFKVYIIDEVHMLSTAAFNALLKTLEEPPEHALFVMATTEPHKIPDTILSRCQRHDFRRVGVEAVAEKLRRICEADGAEADQAALEMVARSGTGSIRDAESLLDQLIATGERVTLEAVREVLGTPADEAVADLVDAILACDSAAGLATLSDALDRGADPRQLRDRLLDHLRGLLMIQTGVEEDLLNAPADVLARMKDQAGRLSTTHLVAAIHRFNDAPPAASRTLPSLPLELALVETVLAMSGDGGGALAAQAGSPAKRAESSKQAAARPKTSRPPSQSRSKAQAEPPDEAPAAESSESESAGSAPAAASDSPAAERGAPAIESIRERWPQVLAAVEGQDRNLAALLKDSRPIETDGGALTLGFFYDFHSRRASAADKTAIIEDSMARILGGSWKLRCIVVPATEEESASRPRSKADQAKSDPVVRHAIESLGARITKVEDDPDAEAGEG